MKKFTWKCVKPLFLKYFFLVFTTLHCQSTDRIRIRWKFSGSCSGSLQKGPDPDSDPQPCYSYIHFLYRYLCLSDQVLVRQLPSCCPCCISWRSRAKAATAPSSSFLPKVCHCVLTPLHFSSFLQCLNNWIHHCKSLRISRDSRYSFMFS